MIFVGRISILNHCAASSSSTTKKTCVCLKTTTFTSTKPKIQQTKSHSSISNAAKHKLPETTKNKREKKSTKNTATSKKHDKFVQKIIRKTNKKKDNKIIIFHLHFHSPFFSLHTRYLRFIRSYEKGSGDWE